MTQRAFAEFFERTPDFVLAFDDKGRVAYANPAAQAIADPLEVLPPGAVRAASESGSWTGEVPVRLDDGRIVDASAVVLRDDAGFIAVLRDITALKDQQTALRRLAERDQLTGLRNRYVLDSHLDHAVAAARRGRVGALLYLDLDHLKDVNDTLDHAAGDRCLALVARALRAGTRAEDVVVRVGGDEFAVLIHDVEPERAIEVADAVRARVAGVTFEERGASFSIGVSVGVALIDGSVPASEVLARADRACYAAKARGRDRVEMFAPDGGPELSRFRLALQPIVRLADRAVVAHEVLLRMVSEDGTLLSAGEFLPEADRMGLAGPVDRFVVSAAAALPGPVSVNLSATAPRDLSIIELAGGRPLTFELPEMAATSSGAHVAAFIEAAHRAGCRVAIDDFGAGLSPFAYLPDLPVDQVKLDRSLLQSKALAATVVLAHDLGIEVVAKGVEDLALLDTLRDAGVDCAQGYALGRPEPANT